MDAAIGDMTVNDNSLKTIFSKRITEEAYPWAYPHIHPENGRPKTLSINKWSKPIKVSFGMPYNARPFVSQIIKGKPATEYETWPWLDKTWIGSKFFYFAQRNKKMKMYETYVTAENEAKSVVEHLSSVLPVQISYLDMEEETTKNYGNLRINLFSMDDLKKDVRVWDEFEIVDIFKRKVDSPLKKVVFDNEIADEILPPVFEKNLKAAHYFTHGKERQVYGYFLSNPENEIDLAVCHIWEGHEPEIIKGLVRECVIRSLGFMDSIKLKTKLQTVPRKDKNTIDKLRIVPKRHRSMLFLWGANDHYDYLASYFDYFEGEFYLTDMDKILIKTLYQPQLLAGTSYLEMQKLIENED